MEREIFPPSSCLLSFAIAFQFSHSLVIFSLYFLIFSPFSHSLSVFSPFSHSLAIFSPSLSISLFSLHFLILSPFFPFHFLIAKLSGSQIKSWVALSSLVVRPVPSRIRYISIYANIYRFWALMPVFIIYMMHVWWYLVVSGACLVVSGACLVLSGACLVVLMYIGWYDRNWYIWADIPSDACNWCANAADALMLLMRCCCLCHSSY